MALKMITAGSGGPNDGSYLGEAQIELASVLTRLADAGATARVAYAEILDELLVRYEQTPNGAQLADLVSAFNRTRNSASPKLPLGTAGTSAEAVATFRNKVAKGYRTRLPLSSLSPDLTQRVAAQFDDIVVEIRATVAQNYAREFEAQSARHQEELSTVRLEFDLQKAAWDARHIDLAKQLEDANAAATEFARTDASKDQRIATLVAHLDALQGQLHASRVSDAVKAESIKHSKANIEELEKLLATAQASASDERKGRLLTLDANRQAGIALESERQQHQALQQRFQDVEAQLQVERRQHAMTQTRVDALSQRPVERDRPLETKATSSSRKRFSIPPAKMPGRLRKHLRVLR